MKKRKAKKRSKMLARSIALISLSTIVTGLKVQHELMKLMTPRLNYQKGGFVGEAVLQNRVNTWNELKWTLIIPVENPKVNVLRLDVDNV